PRAAHVNRNKPVRPPLHPSRRTQQQPLAEDRTMIGFENLEQRRLLSFSVSGGVLTVNGTASADHILVTRDGTNLTIHQNGVNSTTPASAVQKIVVNGLGGNDDLGIAADATH